MNWQLAWGVVSVLLGLINSYFLLRLKLERSETGRLLAEFKNDLLKELETKFVNQSSWELVTQRLDENTKAQGAQIKTIVDEVVKTREHYHNLVNNVISQATQSVSAVLKRQFDKERGE